MKIYEDSGVQFARNVPNYPNYNHCSIQHPQLRVATIQADGLCLSWTTKESTCLSRSISPCSWASCWLVPPTKMKRKANKLNLKRLVWQLIWFILLHTSQVIETNSLAHPLVSSGSRSLQTTAATEGWYVVGIQFSWKNKPQMLACRNPKVYEVESRFLGHL